MNVVTPTMPDFNSTNVAFRRAELHVARAIYESKKSNATIGASLDSAWAYVRNGSSEIQNFIVTRYKEFSDISVVYSVEQLVSRSWKILTNMLKQIITTYFFSLGVQQKTVDHYLSYFPLLNMQPEKVLDAA